MLLITWRRKLYVLTSMCLLVCILNNCNHAQTKVEDFRGKDYAGSAACMNCHKEIYDTYSHTPHSRTSGPALLNTINGSFAAAANAVQYRPSVKVVMEKTDSGFYQVAYLDDVAKQRARFDMVIGSGAKGQSYISWLNDLAFQLPVSHLTAANSWTNSPGYPPKFVLFNRNIPIGCFECHSSYIKKEGSRITGEYLVDYFDKSNIIYGIDCERCHGRSADHVKYHEENPGAKEANSIVSIKTLPREAKLDLCAVCHSGAGETVSSPFKFKPGFALAAYMKVDQSPLKPEDIDVHGKQYQLLSASKCFIKSRTLTCISCHSPHGDQTNNLEVFSQKCISCHQNPAHISTDVIKTIEAAQSPNCINCHMPTKPSILITMKSTSQRDSISAFVRTHYISIYK